MTGDTTGPGVAARGGAGSGAPVLSVEGLSIRFEGAAVDTVQGLRFSVGRGETLCLVGESGCGKSLTSLALMGLLPRAARVVAGQVMVGGRDVLALPERARADLRGGAMAMIFQEPMTALNPVLSLGAQIGEAVLRHRGGTRAAARARALEMLRLVSIPAPEQRLSAFPHQLSGGLRQRAMIAMALANDPALLIADEPTTALDVTIQAQILALVSGLQAQSGTALVLITHDLGVGGRGRRPGRGDVRRAHRRVRAGRRGVRRPAAPLHGGADGLAALARAAGGAAGHDRRRRADRRGAAAGLPLRHAMPVRGRAMPRGAAAGRRGGAGARGGVLEGADRGGRGRREQDRKQGQRLCLWTPPKARLWNPLA